MEIGLALIGALRPAAADYAQLLLQPNHRVRLPVRLRRSRWRFVVAALYAGLVVAVLVVAPGAAGGFVSLIALPLLRAEQHRKARVALVANS